MASGPLLFFLLTVLPAALFIAWIVWMTIALSDIRAELRTIRRALVDRADP